MSIDKSIKQILIEKDEVTLVNSDGIFIGPKDKYEAHKHPAKLHLAISVWLLNSNGQVLFQKRSKQKIVGMGWWANTVCGNVWPTETFFDCANRRLRIELGISGAQIKPVYKFSYKAYGDETYGEHEIDQVYIGKYDGEVVPNPIEVEKTIWLDFTKLLTQISILDYISPEQSILLNEVELKQKTPPVLVKIDENELLIAPWTIFMLKNSKLFEEIKQLA